MAKWYYNNVTGLVREDSVPLAIPLLDKATGWHGPFATKQAALDFYTANKAANPGWKAPTGDLSTGAGNLASSAGSAVASGLGLNDDAIRSWLIRIGEILLGIVLVGVGVAKLTGTTNAVAGLVKAKI